MEKDKKTRTVITFPDELLDKVSKLAAKTFSRKQQYILLAVKEKVERDIAKEEINNLLKD